MGMMLPGLSDNEKLFQRQAMTKNHILHRGTLMREAERLPQI